MLHFVGQEGELKLLVGVDIGGTKTAVVVGARRVGAERDATGLEILSRAAFPTASPWQETVSLVIRTARKLLAEAGPDRGAVQGIGVGCGGPLDSRMGLVLSPPNLPGWDGVPITRVLSETLGAPAFLQNDANACALAEWMFGAGKGCRTMVFLTFGTGMGAGLILDGRLHEGANDLAGEVGHIRLAEDGPEGYGKRGSFEGFCSGGGIAKLAQATVGAALGRGESVSFCAGTGELAAITALSVGKAAEAGDPTARAILAESGRRLGQGVAILIDVLNPERIVIGSIYARCRAFLQPSMEEAIRSEALAPAARVCEIVPAALGESLGDYASLAVAARAGGAA